MLLWLLLLAWGPAAAYALFVGFVSIWLGLRHGQEDGSWLAVFGGALCVLAVLLLFLWISGALFNRRREMQSVPFAKLSS